MAASKAWMASFSGTRALARLIVDGRLFVFSGAKSLDSVRADTAGMVAKGRENWKTLANAPYQ